jgi:ParB-like chromosome segregation protein Spo0J
MTDANMVSWQKRYNLTAHEAADWFDMLDEEQLRSLAASIREHGLLEPINMWQRPEDGVWIVLDGRNRLAAMASLDMDLLELMKLAVHTKDPVGWIYAKNWDRRHLTPEKQRELILKRIANNPERSDRAIAAEVGKSHPTVAAIRKEGEATGKVLPVTKRVGKDNKARKAAVRASKPLTSVSVPSEPPPSKYSALIRINERLIADSKPPLASYLEALEQERDELKTKLASTQLLADQRFEDLDQPDLIRAAQDCIRAMDKDSFTQFREWFREFTGVADDRKDKYVPMIVHLAPSGAAPKRRGRPSKLTDEQRAGILSLTAEGYDAKFIVTALCLNSEQDVYAIRHRAKRGDKGAAEAENLEHGR